MIRAVTERPAQPFIVATETGIMHRMRQMAPEKEFIAADPEAECAFMKTITLPNVRDSLALDRYHITVPPDIAARARRRHRPHGRAREVSARRGADRRRWRSPRTATTDITTAVTVPAGLAGRGQSSSIGAAACWPARPTRTRSRARASCRIEWRAPDGRTVRPGRRGRAWCAGRSRASCAPSGRCSTCCSAPRESPRPPAPTSTRSPAPRCRILHTRKTAPGLRALDIAAVLAGGGGRHRADLSHEVMVKDNHWQALRAERRHAWPRRWTRRGGAG